MSFNFSPHNLKFRPFDTLKGCIDAVVNHEWQKHTLSGLIGLEDNELREDIAATFKRKRDSALLLLAETQINSPYLFLKSHPDQAEADPLDGVIIGKTGYFRILHDNIEQEDGSIQKVDVIVMSKHLEKLALHTDENNQHRLSIDEDPQLYIADAVDHSLDDEKKFKIIQDFDEHMIYETVHNLQFYPECRAIDPDDPESKYAFSIANKGIGFGLHQRDDQKWELWIRPAMRGRSNEADNFAHLPKHLPRDKRVRVFEEEIATFETFSGALDKMAELQEKVALNKWQNKDYLVDKPDVKHDSINWLRNHARNALTAAKSYFSDKKWQRSVTVGLAVAGVSASTSMVSTLGAGLIWASSTILTHMAEDSVNALWNRLTHRSDLDGYHEGKSAINKRYGFMYIEPAPENINRLAPKPVRDMLEQAKAASFYEHGYVGAITGNQQNHIIYTDDRDAIGRSAMTNNYYRIFGGLCTRYGEAGIGSIQNPDGSVSFHHLDINNDHRSIATTLIHRNPANALQDNVPVDNHIPEDHVTSIQLEEGPPDEVALNRERKTGLPAPFSRLSYYKFSFDEAREEIAETAEKEFAVHGYPVKIADRFRQAADPFSAKTSLMVLRDMTEAKHRERLATQALEAAA